MKVEDDTFFFLSLSKSSKRTVLVESVDAIMTCKLTVAAAYQVDRLTEYIAGGLVPAAWCDLVKTEECSVFTFNARQINKSSETVKVVQRLMQKAKKRS
jgi:hypothetical protein